MSGSARAEAMAASVAAAAARGGLSRAEIRRVGAAIRLAMAPREHMIADDHDPAFLHPGRVALILLRDTDAPSALAIQVGVLLESRDAHLGVGIDSVRQALGNEVADSCAAVPHPGAEDLVERLVTLEEEVATAALAERLDHLRHEHLRDPLTPWPELWNEVAEVWLPVAERASPRLARRYRHWLRTFERRLGV